jgi:hypothetical protein
MKTSIILIIAAAITPAAIALGLSAAAALSIVTTIGLSSIALSDYSEKSCYVAANNPAVTRAKKAERLPLAA